MTWAARTRRRPATWLGDGSRWRPTTDGYPRSNGPSTARIQLAARIWRWRSKGRICTGTYRGPRGATVDIAVLNTEGPRKRVKVRLLPGAPFPDSQGIRWLEKPRPEPLVGGQFRLVEHLVDLVDVVLEGLLDVL